MTLMVLLWREIEITWLKINNLTKLIESNVENYILLLMLNPNAVSHFLTVYMKADNI